MVAQAERTDFIPRVAAPVPDRDDSTRFLCAAAHLSPDYADSAVAEMLVEPTRATAPSLGIDAGAVLTEAVAARVRVRLVAATALVTAVVLALLWPAGLAVWFGLSSPLLVVKVVRWVRGGRSARGVGIRSGAVVVVAALALVVLLGFQDGAVEPSPLVLLVLVPLFAVLVANRVVVNRLIATRFQRRGGVQPSPSARLDSPLLSFSQGLAQRVKERYLTDDRFVAPSEAAVVGPPNETDAADWVPVVVHRGYEPFVGAGGPFRPWSMAIPLERDPLASEYQTLSTARLFDSISREVERLRASGPLSPSGRLSRLTSEDVVLISSDELVEHLGAEDGLPFLRDPGHRPHTHISRARAMALRDNPVEWARHFRRFTVLTWDHDLVLSVYLHVAMDESTLYIEWTPCVLRPINDTFRDIDTRHYSVGGAVGQAVVDLLRFPADLPAGISRLFTVARPLKVERGLVNPDKYGALRSLREFAADEGVRTYFQRLDVDRYLKILHTRAIRAVGGLLAEAGYLRASLEQQAQAVVQNSVHIGGALSGSLVMGAHNTVRDINVKGG